MNITVNEGRGANDFQLIYMQLLFCSALTWGWMSARFRWQAGYKLGAGGLKFIMWDLMMSQYSFSQ